MISAENCNSLEKPTRSTEDDADTLPPPAYSAASTVVNGQTSKNKDDFVDTKLTIDEKPKLSNKDKPNSYMKLSVCACIFNVLIGIIAITYSCECIVCIVCPHERFILCTNVSGETMLHDIWQLHFCAFRRATCLDNTALIQSLNEHLN